MAENSGDRSIRLHPSPSGFGGRDSRREENQTAGRGEGRPESVLSGAQAIKKEPQKAIPICALTYSVYHIYAAMSILSFSI